MNIVIENGRVIDPKNSVDRNTSLFIAEWQDCRAGRGAGRVRGRSAHRCGRLCRLPGTDRPRRPPQQHRGGTGCRRRRWRDLGRRAARCRPAARRAGTGRPPGAPGEGNRQGQGAAARSADAWPQGRTSGGTGRPEEGRLRRLLAGQCARWSTPRRCCVPWNMPRPSVLPSGCSRRTIGCRATASRTRAKWPAVSAWPASRWPPKPIAIGTILQLVRDTGCRVHLTRISSAAGLAMLQRAKHDGLPVTCDIGVHHLLLTDNDIGYFNPHARFSPPLRTERDRQALSTAAACGSRGDLLGPYAGRGRRKAVAVRRGQGGRDGPRGSAAADPEVGRSGGRGVARGAGPDHVGAGRGARTAQRTAWQWERQPTSAFSIRRRIWQLTPEALKSRGKNSPWTGYMMNGKVKNTLVGGRLVYQA